MASDDRKKTRSPSPSPAASRRRERPRRRPALADETAVGGALEERARRLEEEFRRLYADLVARKQVSGALRREPEERTVSLELELKPSSASEERRSSVFGQLVEFVEHLARREVAFPRGHVYCHRCRSFDCEHSFPADPRQVFAGYTQTGEPSWREFATVLLEKRDPRIDLLYKPQPCPVALVQDEKELTEAQLAVYGKWSKHFRILGQVMFGYLPVGTNGNQVSVAMCFQAVQTGSVSSAPVLNVVGTTPARLPVVEFLESQSDPRITNALLTTRQLLGDLALVRSSRRRRPLVLRQSAAAILQRLSRNLERIYRQRQRRTRHSEARHLDRRRPAATAFRDALRAHKESIFRDVEAKTWVVIGPKNRVHIFNDSALHVTSVVYQGETIRQRTRHGRWLAPRGAALISFRAALARHGRE